MSGVRMAILDMNAGHPNQGMRCLRDIANEYVDRLSWDEFDVRVDNVVPDLDYDIFICSGGPGNPLEGNGDGEVKFYNLLDEAWNYNKDSTGKKKFFFFICHSFQMACNHFELGEIMPRKSTSFGVYPVHKTAAGKRDAILDGLPDPYYAVDSRDWQLIQPNLKVFKEHGATILSLEKIRTHVELERAIMAVRFSDEFVGTQFHPEADPVGMKAHFEKEENREKVIKNFSKRKYTNMMIHLEDPDKIALTHSSIIPHFIETALEKLIPEEVLSK
ncbi:MAG: GMP synthase [Cyclobacteriaceae bacterium]